MGPTSGLGDRDCCCSATTVTAAGMLHGCDEPQHRRREPRRDLGRSMHWKDVATPSDHPSARRCLTRMVPHHGRDERVRVGPKLAERRGWWRWLRSTGEITAIARQRETSHKTGRHPGRLCYRAVSHLFGNDGSSHSDEGHWQHYCRSRFVVDRRLHQRPQHHQPTSED